MRSSDHARLAGLPALVFAFLTIACGGAGAPPAGSGIEGMVTIGPLCPVQREDLPCPDRPFEATIVIEDQDGNEVARVDSDRDGRFRILLAPGRYSLVPQGPNPRLPPYAEEQQIEVTPDTFTQVTIRYDSGIR